MRCGTGNRVCAKIAWRAKRTGAAGRYVANRCADLLAKIEPLLADDAGAK
jgi:hypothetical protein